jgi:hypothetical protein
MLGVQNHLMDEFGLTKCLKNYLHFKTSKYEIRFSRPIIKHYCDHHEFKISNPSGIYTNWKWVE